MVFGVTLSDLDRVTNLLLKFGNVSIPPFSVYTGYSYLNFAITLRMSLTGSQVVDDYRLKERNSETVVCQSTPLTPKLKRTRKGKLGNKEKKKRVLV